MDRLLEAAGLTEDDLGERVARYQRDGFLSGPTLVRLAEAAAARNADKAR